MLNLKNHVTLVGNMGMNAEITSFDNGNKVARFSLATDKNYKTKDGQVEKNTEWHRVFAWGNMAQFIENYGEKGKPLAIHGRLVNRTYLSKEGKQRNITEVEIKHIIGL
jgi:single-strand DNA-binding protein